MYSQKMLGLCIAFYYYFVSEPADLGKFGISLNLPPFWFATEQLYPYDNPVFC